MLARARRRKRLPLITDPARAGGAFRKFFRASPEQARLAGAMLDLDLRATRLYTHLQACRPEGDRNRDFFQPVLTLQETHS